MAEVKTISEIAALTSSEDDIMMGVSNALRRPRLKMDPSHASVDHITHVQPQGINWTLRLTGEQCKIFHTIMEAIKRQQGHMTTHSKFKIHVPTFDNFVCNIHQGIELAELLKQTKLIIWDEAPMTNKFCFEALDKSLGDILGTTNDSVQFGGKIVVFGDYDNPIAAIVSRTYPNLQDQDHYKDEQFLQSRAILASTIEIVDQINDYVLSQIPGGEKEYLSSDEVDMSDANESESFNILIPEFLNSFSISGLPNHKIKLKVGTTIMLLRNIDQSEGLCNGTRLVVTRMTNHVLETKIMSGKNIGNVTYIPRLSMSPSQCLWPFTLIRRQFLITMSYAMTINKSQGQSLESVRLYLPRPIFSHGQLYVDVSRVQNKK
ncbi:hypothetical protein Lal_00010780 [Lupinus albus]|nr:hypothetical protein Lal_00010780 [Lupinus albus]